MCYLRTENRCQIRLYFKVSFYSAYLAYIRGANRNWKPWVGHLTSFGRGGNVFLSVTSAYNLTNLRVFQCATETENGNSHALHFRRVSRFPVDWPYVPMPWETPPVIFCPVQTLHLHHSQMSFTLLIVSSQKSLQSWYSLYYFAEDTIYQWRVLSPANEYRKSNVEMTTVFFLFCLLPHFNLTNTLINS